MRYVSLATNQIIFLHTKVFFEEASRPCNRKTVSHSGNGQSTIDSSFKQRPIFYASLFLYTITGVPGAGASARPVFNRLISSMATR